MSEDILLSFEGHRERTAIAAYFRQLADGLDGDGAVTFSEGDESVTLRVPDTPEFEVEIEREQEDDEIEYEIELELEWSTTDAAAGELTIEAGEPSKADESSPAGEESPPADTEEPTPPTADDEQETIEESVEDAGGDVDDDESVTPPGAEETRSEVDAAEDDEASQSADDDADHSADDEHAQSGDDERTDGGSTVQTNEGTTATVVSMTEPATETGRFECYTDRRDQWRWRLCRADGQTLAICTKGHESREAATAEIDDIKRLTGQADVTDDPAA